jgi:hypothetical protein
MRLKALAAAAAFVALASPAFAQLEVYKDYTISDAVWEVSTVKVDSNMGDYYLEGLKSTWVESNEVAKSLGHIESYAILASVMPDSGDFNLILSVRFASMADYAPSKAKYDAFMTAWGEANADASRETVKTYPELREITGQYLMQELKMVPASE